MKTKSLYLSSLLGILMLFNACKEDTPNPLRFYNDTYEVPMGGTRYLGLESGNGDYSLIVADTRIASAGSQSGWSTVGGKAIYVNGILTGKTTLEVIDDETQESCTLQIKVTDSYESLRLQPLNGMVTSLQNMAYVFLINNGARDVYFFRQASPQTAFSDGLELITKGSYDFERSNGKIYLTLTFAESQQAQAVSHRFIVPDNPYVIHRFDKYLSLGWDTTFDNASRTSSKPDPSYSLQEDTETGNSINFSLTPKEIPMGILP